MGDSKAAQAAARAALEAVSELGGLWEALSRRHGYRALAAGDVAAAMTTGTVVAQGVSVHRMG